MRDAVVALPTPNALAGFVHATLCEADALDPGQCALHSVRLTRGGRPCGVLFYVEGPRRLRPSAVWAADENRVLFYGTTGERAGEVRLSEAPDLRADRGRRAA